MHSLVLAYTLSWLKCAELLESVKAYREIVDGKPQEMCAVCPEEEGQAWYIE